MVLTVVFRPNPSPSGTLPTLEAGLPTVVLQALIEGTHCRRSTPFVGIYAQTSYGTGSFPGTLQCLRLSRRSSTTGSASTWRSYKESRAPILGDFPIFRRFSAV